jgi:hypothetical protein
LPREAPQRGQGAAAPRLSSDDELLIGVTNILVILTLDAAGSDCDLLGPLLWHPFIAFGAPLRTLVSCLGWCSSTATGGCFPAALNENSPDHLLTRGMPGGDVEELLCVFWLVMAELMHQGSAVCAGPEHRDDVGITDFGELVTLSGETLNVVPHGFTLLQPATL